MLFGEDRQAYPRRGHPETYPYSLILPLPCLEREERWRDRFINSCENEISISPPPLHDKYHVRSCKLIRRSRRPEPA
uniref:Uncharacterized protein n=1 Tax=Picea glauca TaxID=3330 RepID=A0A101LVX2_PICGL|nr:hypothetical protein ABT39_MTgene1835 [Picea glauca]